ncbi:hypothetical protein EIN_335590 [Entamoeba invadens IP1]|uniref:Uncharacterized protein n=1 Tax=Entamoeba invadens IP1 TaxID=370355 RepID=L7FLI3_ENTIV|nr:hypothetical protein EIN_335590 [Entamoeba invadens IP1]ELP88577.1 hypothetical protein EIN_335590 [Entamoeba invadens IP1]|eukprot:XP_004255348.1 hypothetical protein EIN_335590 [Entamoeba invadens IP1]
MASTSLFKVVVLGEANVGKTSLLTQYITKKFYEKTKSTVGADFITHEVEVDGQTVVLQIWDTAGSERFCSLGPVFFRGAECCVLVCDMTNAKSFEKIDSWKKVLLSSLSQQDDIESFPFVIVGNKSDCTDEERQVTFAQLSAYGGGKYSYFECSAKTGWNVDTIFIEVAKILKQKSKILSNSPELIEPCRLDDITEKVDKKKSCCN